MFARRVSIAILLPLIVAALAVTELPAETQSHGIGIGLTGAYLDDDLPSGASPDDSLSADFFGYNIFGRFGEAWGFGFSFRGMETDDRASTGSDRESAEWMAVEMELQEASLGLSTFQPTDLSCCDRSSANYQLMEFTVYRTWFHEKFFRPYAEAGLIFGEYDFKYLLLDGLGEDLRLEGRESSSDTFNSPMLGFGIDLGPADSRFAFMWRNSLYNLDTESYDYECDGLDCDWRRGSDDILTLEMTFAFLYRFGE